MTSQIFVRIARKDCIAVVAHFRQKAESLAADFWRPAAARRRRQAAPGMSQRTVIPSVRPRRNPGSAKILRDHCFFGW